MREAVAKLTCWLANTRPLWAAYCVIVAGCLIALNKCPAVRQIGEIKILLKMMGAQGRGILLVGAWDLFNKANIRVMLWNVHHSQTTGSCFAFNT
eukprot:242997-Ditylum_brightwellii.AAC.1